MSTEWSVDSAGSVYASGTSTPHIRYTATGDIGISWPHVTAILGHHHCGTPEDDATLMAWLLAQAQEHGDVLPDWVHDAYGYLTECGWFLERPLSERQNDLPYEED